MSDSILYSELAARTGGAIMLGVVGPVRTGKSSLSEHQRTDRSQHRQ